MSAFDYLSVLLSIILGLGITQILTALGRLIRQRERVVGYWPAWLWSLNLLLIHVQMWWAMFELRDRPEWTFLAFGVVLLQPVVLYMAAALVLPADDDDRLYLREHYHRQAPWLFGFLVALGITSVLKDLALDGALPQALNLGFHAIFIFVSTLAAVVRDPRVHAAIAFTGSATLLIYITLLFSRLG